MIELSCVFETVTQEGLLFLLVFPVSRLFSFTSLPCWFPLLLQGSAQMSPPSQDLTQPDHLTIVPKNTHLRPPSALTLLSFFLSPLTAIGFFVFCPALFRLSAPRRPEFFLFTAISPGPRNFSATQQVLRKYLATEEMVSNT